MATTLRLWRSSTGGSAAVLAASSTRPTGAWPLIDGSSATSLNAGWRAVTPFGNGVLNVIPVTSVNGPTTGLEGGAFYISAPVDQDFTMSGTINATLWGTEAAMTANAGIGCRIFKISRNGTSVTLVGSGFNTTELGTTSASRAISITPTSTAFQKGDRIGFTYYFADAGGTMAAGSALNMRAGATSAGTDGDSNLVFTETFGFMESTPGGSTVYFQNGASPVGGISKEAWTSRGSGVQTATTTTVTGPTSGVKLTLTSGGSNVDWVTKPLTAFTLTGPVLVNLRGLTTNAPFGSSATALVVISVVDNDGSNAVEWARTRSLDYFQTSEAVVAQFVLAGPDTAIANGKRIKIEIFLDDMDGANNFGAMTSGINVDFKYAGTSSNATGDSWVRFNQTLTEFTGGVSTVNGSFTANAVIRKTGQPGSFTANAVIQGTGNTIFSDFTANAVLKRNMTGSKTADAVISGASPGPSKTLYLREVQVATDPLPQIALGDVFAGLGGSGSFLAYLGGRSLTETRNTLTSTNVGSQPSVTGPATVDFGAGSTGGFFGWVSDPLTADFTIAGAVTFNIWAEESQGTGNIGLRAAVYAVSSTGAIRQIAIASRGIELTTSPAAYNWTATPTSPQVVRRGERLMVRIAGVDAGGTMSSGKTFTIYDNGTSAGGQGDSYVTFAEALTFSRTAPSGSTVYLTSVDSDAPVAGKTVKVAWTDTPTGGAATATAASANGPTAPIQFQSGGQGIEWYTPALQGFWLGGRVEGQVYGSGSPSNALIGNMSPRIEVAICDADGSNAVVWASGLTAPYNDSTQTYEFGDSATTIKFVLSGPSTAVAEGQRLRIRVYIDDTPETPDGVQLGMVSGYTATLSYNGTPGSTSDCKLTFSQSLVLAGGLVHRFGTFTANAVIRKGQTGSFTANAVLSNAVRQFGSFAADSLIKRKWTVTFTANAVIQGVSSQTFSRSFDAVIKSLGVSDSFTVGAFITKPAPPALVIASSDGQDWTDRIIYRTATFISQVNGTPGTFSFVVRDDDHTFVPPIGKKIYVTIEGIRYFTGFITKVTRQFAFAVPDMSDPNATTRMWKIEGSDINILLQRRVAYYKAHPERGILPPPVAYRCSETKRELWAEDTPVSVVVPYVVKHYTDLPSDGIAIEVPNFGSPMPDACGALSGAMTIGQVLSSINKLLQGVFYIHPYEVLRFHDADTVTTPYYLTDSPTEGDQYAVAPRDYEFLSDASKMVNDALVWGVAMGSDQVVFSRATDNVDPGGGEESSVTTHGRWQWGDFGAPLYKQASVDYRASSAVYGLNQSQKGARWDRVVVQATTFRPVFQLGDVVTCHSKAWYGTRYEPFDAPSGNAVGSGDLSIDLPVRRVEITFPTPRNPQFRLTLTREVDEPFNAFEYLFPRYEPPYIERRRPPRQKPDDEPVREVIYESTTPYGTTKYLVVVYFESFSGNNGDPGNIFAGPTVNQGILPRVGRYWEGSPFDEWTHQTVVNEVWCPNGTTRVRFECKMSTSPWQGQGGAPGTPTEIVFEAKRFNWGDNWLQAGEIALGQGETFAWFTLPVLNPFEYLFPGVVQDIALEFDLYPGQTKAQFMLFANPIYGSDLSTAVLTTLDYTSPINYKFYGAQINTTYSAYSSGTTSETLEWIGGSTYNLTNRFFTGTTRVWKNGVRQRLGTDYTENSLNGTITFTSSPLSTDVIYVQYVAWEQL